MNAEEFEKKLAPLTENTGFEIADIKVAGHSGKLLLQIFIDKEEGSVTLSDCEAWTDKIGSYIDMNGIISGGYVLEVSSPGVDRIIKKEKDFLKFKGMEAKITLKKPFNGSRVYYGKIEGFENGEALFSEGLRFKKEDLQEVRLNPDYEQLLKNKAR